MLKKRLLHCVSQTQKFWAKFLFSVTGYRPVGFSIDTDMCIYSNEKFLFKGLFRSVWSWLTCSIFMFIFMYASRNMCILEYKAA